MSFDIVKQFDSPAWLAEISEKLDRKMAFGAEKARGKDYIPYTTENGDWAKSGITWWTNGFWPAGMWQMYLMTGKALYRKAACRAEEMLDEALRDFKSLHHDVGFMWLISAGVHWALEKDEKSFDRALFAAGTLAARYNPNGFLRAWNGDGKEGWAIVDCMMNLSLLYWASNVTGDPRYRLIAMRHADTTLREFVRPDGSCNHIVIFDPVTGEHLEHPAGQGAYSGSSWSRGQAWGLYGFTLSYLNTGKAEYLDAAKRIANYFISQIADDFIPRCDFRQPAEPDIRDNAAGNIAACGLLELSRAVPESEAPMYYRAAVSILKAQEARCADWSEAQPAVFTKCTASYSNGHHITMNYADYYFIEAVNMLLGVMLLFWRPYPVSH